MSRVSESDTTLRPQSALHLCFASYLRLTLVAWNEEFRTSYQDSEIQKIMVITLTKFPLYDIPGFFQNCGRYSLLLKR